MFNYSVEDTISALKQAKNLNATVKNFLKKEANGDARAQKFAKELREISLSKVPGAFDNFVKNHLPEYEPHFLIVVKIAFQEQLTPVVEQIATQYADTFNETYERVENGPVKIKDKAKFSEIVKVSLTEITKAVGENPFVQFAACAALFDVDVLAAIRTQL